MNAYTQRVADNILPLSRSGTLPDAFKEWQFTEETEDHEQAVENCELCDQEQLRYHFKIKNKYTEHVLWVGSSCILRFKVAVFDDYGKLLDEKSSEKKLNSLIKDMQLSSCINALQKLVESENNEILKSALDYFLKNKYLTPKQAFVIFWRLNKHKIDYHPSFFKVSLRKNKYKEDLRNMPLDRVHIIWPALTSAQKKTAIELGHSQPNPSPA